MKSEFEQEAKDLTKNLNSKSEAFRKTYQQLKRILYFQLLIMFALLSFVFIALVVPDATRHRISYMIIPLIMINYLLAILHRNDQKRKLKKVYEDGTDLMGRLSDIIDWTSVRNKYINKDDKKVVDAITTFVIFVEKPLSPFRHFNNYYRFVLYLSLLISILTFIYYIVYCLSLIDACNLSILREYFLNWFD